MTTAWRRASRDQHGCPGGTSGGGGGDTQAKRTMKREYFGGHNASQRGGAHSTMQHSTALHDAEQTAQQPLNAHTVHTPHHSAQCTVHIIHHTSHITSHVTHHTSHITVHITHHTSHITHHTSQCTSHITHHSAHCTSHTSTFIQIEAPPSPPKKNHSHVC